jgi:hypothetical protein
VQHLFSEILVVPRLNCRACETRNSHFVPAALEMDVNLATACEPIVRIVH